MGIPVLSYISCVSYIGPIVFGIVRFRHLDRPMKMFLLLCVILFFDHIIQIIFALASLNNLAIIRYGNFTETLLLGCVYIASVERSRTRAAFIGVLVCFAVVWGAAVILTNHPGKFDSIAIALGMIITICYAMIYLIREFRYTTTPITHNPMFWVAVGNLLYNVGAVIIIGLANELSKMGNVYFYNAWQINYILIIIANGFYLKGFLCKTP